MEFITIDVETANPDLSSICQIGIALFKNGSIVDEWKSYVNPEDYFNVLNTAIHGIDESTVQNSPKLPEIADRICEYLAEHVTVSHTYFDRAAIHQAFNKYEIIPPNCRWLDSAGVARRTWEEFSRNGYGLYNLCSYLGYEFKHHDALEDAKAAGYILISAIERTGIDVESWLKRVKQPINLSSQSVPPTQPEPVAEQPAAAAERPRRERKGKPAALSTPLQELKQIAQANPDGPLYGEVLVFTGALDILRREAADMAAKIGCQVESGVNKNTTLLVVGDQDVRRLAGHEKSLKHRKAEKLISEGQSIRILRETDFKELANLSY